MRVENIYATSTGIEPLETELIATLILRYEGNDPFPPGAKFWSDRNDPQQVATISHPRGHVVPRHSHNKRPRTILVTQETLVVLKGSVRLHLYSSYREDMGSRVLVAGDVAVLIHGGHSIEVLEDVEMIEIKQGPYTSKDEDKVVW